MARRNRDLAGLAALGALGLYAARGSKKTDAEAAATPVEDRGPMVRPAAAVAASTEADRPDDRDVGMISGASPSGLYRNTESGDIFSTNRPTRPARPPAARRYTKAEQATDLARETARGSRGPIVAKQAPSTLEGTMGAYVGRRAAPEREPEYVSKRKPNVVYDAQGNEVRPLKKGGAVKKMASGGMTASKRADGIASRGKTKCKMY